MRIYSASEATFTIYVPVEALIVEHLQELVENARMRSSDFIEEHHAEETFAKHARRLGKRSPTQAILLPVVLHFRHPTGSPS
ncbi:hypothetical protein BGV49_14420 [Burkholderia ubonensis]|nr:hypothetical protein BGV49_14420 [Burkholderia ubonensis]